MIPSIHCVAMLSTTFGVPSAFDAATPKTIGTTISQLGGVGGLEDLGACEHDWIFGRGIRSIPKEGFMCGCAVLLDHVR